MNQRDKDDCVRGGNSGCRSENLRVGKNEVASFSAADMKRAIHTAFRTIPGLLCLAAYLLSTPLAPLGTAVLAWIDGEHRVHLVNQEQGARVILAHDNQDPRRASSHHHCLASTALVLFAAPLVPGEPDHVLSFQSGNSGALWERLPTVNAPDTAFAFTAYFDSAAILPSSIHRLGPQRIEAPPDPTSLTVVRSTVFLI